MFEWEKDDLSTYKVTGEEEPIFHLTLNTEIPWAVLEDDVEDVQEAVIETPGPSLGERVDTARRYAGLSNNTGVSSKLTVVQYTPSTPYYKLRGTS